MNNMKEFIYNTFGGNVIEYKEEEKLIEFKLNVIKEVGIDILYINKIFLCKQIIMFIIDENTVMIRLSF